MTAPIPLLRVVVLVSGRGSNLMAIAARADAGELPVRIEAVVISPPNSPVCALNAHDNDHDG